MSFKPGDFVVCINSCISNNTLMPPPVVYIVETYDRNAFGDWTAGITLQGVVNPGPSHGAFLASRFVKLSDYNE